jgi:hypothetical protein
MRRWQAKGNGRKPLAFTADVTNPADIAKLVAGIRSGCW